MANFCLLPSEVEKFKRGLKEKELNIGELLNMSTEARTELLSKYVGDSADKVNTLFEEKLVLKNRIAGLKNWASKVGQIGRYDPIKKAQIDEALIDFRAKQQERILNPKETESFLNDLADKVLGTHVTEEEARTVYELTKQGTDLRSKFDTKTNTWSSEEDRLKYGANQVVLEKYVQGLSNGEPTIKGMLQDVVDEFKATAETNKPKAVKDVAVKAIQTVFDNSIALVASIDNSFIGRQGIHVLMTHPTKWLPVAAQSFSDIAKTLAGQDVKDALLADIYSRPNYINGAYKNAGFIGVTEEQFPTSLPERIPVLGRAFKASEMAFGNSALRMRTNLYDLISEQVSAKGEVDMSLKENQKGLGTVINSLTAKGSLGRGNEGGLTKLLLWSPRMLKANLDILTAHTGQDIPPFARREAQKNLLKIIGVTAGVIAIFAALNPNDIELNPTSTNFGKVRVFGKWIDITGGMGGIVVLASRIVAGLTGHQIKNASTGTKSKLNSGEYGSRTVLDVFTDFFLNKTSPGVGVIVDIMRGKTFNGQKPTIGNELYAKGVPISIQNTLAIKQASDIFGVVADFIGLSNNSQEFTNKDWNNNPTNELQSFKEKVGEEEFKKANKKYNDEVNKQVSALVETDKYKKLSDDGKKAAISKIQEDVKKQIFDSYDYKTFENSKDSNWDKSKSKAIQQLKDKLSPEDFSKANQEYNDTVTQRINQKVKEEKYQKLPDDTKKKELTKIRKAVEKEIFRKYNFTPKVNRKTSF